MDPLALLLVCLSCSGNGRRRSHTSRSALESGALEDSRKSLRVAGLARGSRYDARWTAQEFRLLRAAAALILACDPMTGFKPYGFKLEGHHCLKRPSSASVHSWVRNAHQGTNKRAGHHHSLMMASDMELGDLPQLDVAGLKKEADRQYKRAVKKVGKANDRLRKAEEAYEKFLADPDASEEDIEKLPNSLDIEKDLQSLQERSTSLMELQCILNDVKSSKSERYMEAVELATLLEVTDAPPERPPPKKKKKGGKQRDAPRKPYFVYTSADNLEIRVGRRAPDNDELSCNPEHRDGRDWWMHVSGSAGSHVVIRCHDDLSEKFPETVKDAALLAAANSKGPQSGTVSVSLVRARQVSKPPMAKPGLVRLSGNVIMVRTNVAAENNRMERLAATKTTG